MDEFKVKLAPHVGNKKYTVFKLHKDDNVSWQEAKMRRENENQPWQIKFGSGRIGRRFKAIKEGGVGDNASYFVFYKPNDKSDTYEVCPVEEWYNVSATQRYKTLTAEEAELKFEQRHKMFNLFSVMHLKKNGENGEEGVGGSDQDSRGFKVSELDDWDQSGDDEASDDNEETGGNKKKNQKKKGGKKDKDDPEDAPEEAKEDSDEGDFEQREVDYMSDSSSDLSEGSNDDVKDETDVKGIAEEEALRDLLSTDDEEDGDNPQQKGSKSNENKMAISSGLDGKKSGEGSDDSSDSDDYDVDEDKMDSMFMKKSLPAHLSMVKPETKPDPEQPSGSSGSVSGAGTGNGGSSSSSRPVSGSSKRKAPSSEPQTSQTSSSSQPTSKRPCIPEISSTSSNPQEKIVEDLIRKYLTRKPMTLKGLLKDIKSKLKRIEGVSPEFNADLVNTLATIIKRLQPDKQKINEVVYFSLKS